MTGPRRVVLVGGGLAAAKTAQSLRKRGYDGELTLLGAEAHRPYERPPLSKSYLTGASEREDAFVHDADWYAEQGVDLVTGATVVALDRERRELRTGAGDRYRYDAVLLATGAVPRRLPVPGTDLGGVLTVRTLEDSEVLRERLARRDPLVVVGGGWLGLEVAAAARLAGCEVTVVEAAEQPLLRVLGPSVGAAVAALHRDRGVRFELSAAIEAIVGDAGGEVAGVRLAGGRLLPAGTVLLATGVTPADWLARAAGLEVADGVVVGADLRTADPSVVAAGDVANVYHPVLRRRVRFEHWANAVRQAPVAAAALVGEPKPYERLPYAFSDQYETSLEYVGAMEHPERAQVVVRGSLEERRFVAFWLEGEQVRAGMSVDVPGVVPALEELVRSGRPADPARLADPAAPLEAVDA